MVIFSWGDKAGFLRTATIKEKSRDYVSAVRLLGASPGRIVFRHMLPNMAAILVTFLPFTVAARSRCSPRSTSLTSACPARCRAGANSSKSASARPPTRRGS